MFRYHPDDLIHYLALCHLPQMGSARLGTLFAQFDDFAAIFKSNRTELMALGFSESLALAILKPNYRLAEQELSWLKEKNQAILTWFDPNYPAQLQQIPAKPPILYAKGQLHLLATTQMAIVGSRNPSASGLMNTQLFSTQLSQCGYTVTSGLALGIDAKAHQAALAASGATIGVLGTGLNHIYPKCHENLAQQITEQGLLVSEFALKTSAKAENFPRRNRIISGLSLGVLVVEAALKSGSLITARYALEQNREVFAIPGAIHNPLARGCHALIRQGAKLVETLNDIVEELPSVANKPVITPRTVNHPQGLSALEQKLLALLTADPIPLDYLVEHTGLSVPVLTAAIAALEINGCIQETPCGYINLLEQTYESQCA